MKEWDSEAFKQGVLDKLHKAGAAGLTKGKFGIAKSEPKQAAFKELEKEGAVVNLGSAARSLYVLKEFDRPLEMACDRVETLAASRTGTLFSRSKMIKMCEKSCPTRIKKELGRAVDWLAGEQKLLKFKYGRTFLFVHASAVAGKVTPEKPKEPKEAVERGQEQEEPDRGTVLQAYRKVCRQIGFSDVEIYRLQQELGADMEALKAFIRGEARQGRAVLSLGDWSLSSEAVRSGAIESRGRQYLLVRFKNGG